VPALMACRRPTGTVILPVFSLHAYAVAAIPIALGSFCFSATSIRLRAPSTRYSVADYFPRCVGRGVAFRHVAPGGPSVPAYLLPRRAPDSPRESYICYGARTSPFSEYSGHSASTTCFSRASWGSPFFPSRCIPRLGSSPSRCVCGPTLFFSLLSPNIRGGASPRFSRTSWAASPFPSVSRFVSVSHLLDRPCCAAFGTGG
jgi:hypothetical protein